MRGLELERIHSTEGYEHVCHGTFEEAWESIKTQVNETRDNLRSEIWPVKKVIFAVHVFICSLD